MANMKQYIISFRATLQGHKMVLTQLKGMERQMTGVRKVTEKGTKATKGYGAAMGKLATRAMLVIPVWLVLRAAMMTVMRTFGDMVRVVIDLEDQLARIRTVMHGSAEVIDAEMVAIKRQIIDTSLKSRIAIKDLAEGFYFLKTANLDATEAMAAFEPTVSLAIGTMNSMGESARAVAGIYNTMGQYLGDNLTIHEKFQHIADVLAYTYSTQDVQLSELIQSYTKLAPYVTGLSDNFLELTTMLGFLNTRLLRGGRTGRLTGRAILQLTKNASKLAKVFGITFDPDKPIAFLDTVKMIRDAMGKTGKVTAEQGQIIQEVFATRGGVAVRLLIEHFDDLSNQIKDAVENADGFAQKMKELRMDTIAGQMARMKNILGVLMDDFVTTAYGAENLADAIKLLNASFESMRPIAKGTGTILAYLGAGFRENYYWVRAYIEAMKEMPTRGIPLIGGTPTLQLRRAAELIRQYREEDVKGIQETQKAREKYFKNEEKIKTLREEQLVLTEKHFNLAKEGRLEEAQKIQKSIDLIEDKITNLQPAEIRLQKLLNKERDLTNQLEKTELGLLDKIEQKEKHQIRLMKNLGANALDIARAELQILENQTLVINERKEELELIKAKYRVIEEEVKYREQITNVLQRAEVDMAKVLGANELQILQIREKHLNIQRENIGQTQYLLKLGQLRTQQAIALQQQKQKELQQATNLYMMYEKADMMERGRIRRLIELMSLTPDELAGRFRKDMYDQKIILQYWNNFSQQAQQAMGEAIRQMERLPLIKVPIPEMPEVVKKLLPHEEISEYWQVWIGQGRDAAGFVAGEFTKAIKKIPFGGILEGRKELPRPEIKPNFTVNINLPEDTLERMAELSGERLTEKLKTDEALQKFLAQALRPYI